MVDGPFCPRMATTFIYTWLFSKYDMSEKPIEIYSNMIKMIININL